MDFEDFITAASEFASLGASMQAQFDALLEGERLPSDYLNANAVRNYIAPFVLSLPEMNVKVPDDLYDYLDSLS